MLRSKTITSKVFPLLEGLPEKVIEDIKFEENDKAFLFEPSTSVTETESKYYCLACGRHGKTNDSVPVCPHCGNHNSRPFRTEKRSMLEALIYRYVHPVEGGYLFIREFICNPVENEENGIIVEPQETTRVCIKDGELLTFVSERRYNGGVTESCWKKRDSIYSWGHNEVHLISTVVIRHDPVLSKVDQFLTQPMSKLFEELKLAVAGCESKESSKFPNASFPSEEYLTEVVEPLWIAKSYDTPAGEADHFVHRHSWCTNCGQYHMKVVDKERYYTSTESSCLKCGTNVYSRHRSHYLMDALELEGGGALLRINYGQRKKEFAGPNIIGVDPTVILKYETVFTNYILIASDGEVSFFNEEKQHIEQLQVPLFVGNSVKEFFYTEEAKRIISTNPAVARTGFNCYFERKPSASPKYFEHLKQFPCLEIFAKFGFSKLVDDILGKNVTDLPAYFRKEFKESRFSKLTKPQIKSMRESVVTLKVLIAYMQVLNKDREALYGDLYDITLHAHERHVLDILRVGIPGMTVRKIAEYIQNVDDFQCCPPNESMQLWSDYLRMLRDSECDLTDSKLVFTNSLKREHDKMSRKITQIRNEKLSVDFANRAADNEWLEYKGTRLSAIIPRELSEIYEEGRKLNHCVGGYAKRIVDGETVIAFLRENNKVDRPYCTVEIRNHRIVQARGFSNREGRLIPGVSDFLKIWAKEKNLTVDVA